MLQSGLLNHLDQVSGCTVGNQSFTHQVDGVGGGLLCTGSGADHQSVLALQSVHEVAQRSDGGVGCGGDGADDADGVSDLDQTLRGILVDDAHGLLILQVCPEGCGGIGVLADLVLEIAQAGLFDGFLGQRHCVLVDDLGDLVDQLVYLGLIVILDGCLRCACGNDLFLNRHGSCLLYFDSFCIIFKSGGRNLSATRLTA